MQKYSGNELIQSLFKKGEAEPVKIEASELGSSAEVAVEKAMGYVAEATQILSNKSPGELADYKELIYSVGDRVADAAGSGLFDSGAKETAVLEKLKAALA